MKMLVFIPVKKVSYCVVAVMSVEKV